MKIDDYYLQSLCSKSSGTIDEATTLAHNPRLSDENEVEMTSKLAAATSMGSDMTDADVTINPQDSVDPFHGLVDTVNSQEETTHNQELIFSDPEQNPPSTELKAPSASRDRRKLQFPISDTDETDEENRVFNDALAAVDDLTSVPEESGPDDDDSSQDVNRIQQESINPRGPNLNIKSEENSAPEVSADVPFKAIALTPSRKRPLSLTRDSSSKYYHVEKRFRSRMEELKTAINNDHPLAHTSSKGEEATDDLELNQFDVHPEAVSHSQITIPETDDEELKGTQSDACSLDQEDIDFLKEGATDAKALISNLMYKGEKAVHSRLPQCSMMLKTSEVNSARSKVESEDEAKEAAKASKKGKSTKSSSQPSKGKSTKSSSHPSNGKSTNSSTQPSKRKQLLEKQNSQSSQEFVTSSQTQDPNSDDEFKPRRTRRNVLKKNSK